MRLAAICTGLVGLLAVSSLAAQTQTAPASPLDGTTWAVKVTPDVETARKGEKVFDDVIMLRYGRVAMSECLKHGFKASKYTAAPSGEAWSFETEQVSEKEGKSVWKAVIKGDTIRGTLLWTKKDGTISNYTFEGTKASR